MTRRLWWKRKERFLYDILGFQMKETSSQCTYVLVCLVFIVAIGSLTWSVVHEESEVMIECEVAN